MKLEAFRKFIERETVTGDVVRLPSPLPRPAFNSNAICAAAETYASDREGSACLTRPRAACLPACQVMMMDANDVLFVGDGQRILDAYQAAATPIVASAERGCAPATSGLEVRAGRFHVVRGLF
jgi:hypothetical protein